MDDYLEDDSTEFSVLAAAAGKGVAELLVDPVFQGWRRALRITGFMQGWRTRYCHKGHLIPNEDCRVCKLGEHKWDPRNETKKAEDYFFRWESGRVRKKLKAADLKKFRIQDGIVLDSGRLSPDFQLKAQDLDGVGYLDKHKIGGEVPVVLSDSPVLYAYLMYIHTKSLAHSGVESTVKEVHKKMRVVKGLRCLIRKIIAGCIKCRLMEKEDLGAEIAESS